VALLVILHIGAALFHHVILRDGVLRRMLPLAFGGR
jgi:cytochrome b561